MLNLKVSFLFAVNCILIAHCLDSDEVVSPVVAQDVSPVEAGVKINWVPVWDDNEGNTEFVARISERDGEEGNEQNCKSPNGLGLQNLFQEVEKILPKQQIRAIAKSYSEDPEIKALKAFVASSQTKHKIKVIRDSKEYQILKDYVCRVLHIDLIKYNKLARTLSNPLLTRVDAQPRKGIRGLIQEINAVLPRQQIRELYQDLLASDEELVMAVANLKSKEFHQLLLNIKNNVPEYKELRQQMIELGVPIEEMQQLLLNTFGWAPELDVVV